MLFSVSAEIYEVLSLALRYVFAFLGVLIVLRTWVRLLADRREKSRRLRHLPDAGMIGELVVLSGSRDLPADTRLSVPREGVLGSIRSCDLVVPCEGVRKNHLDFSWQDGVGLLIRPRSGCEASVDQVSLSCRSNPLSAPLRSGSLLQVGAATLRLLTFVGLDASMPEASEPPVSAGPDMPPAPYAPQNMPPFFTAPTEGPSPFDAQPASPCSDSPPSAQQVLPPVSGEPEEPSGTAPTPAAPRQAPPSSPPRRRRSDRWKEDWSD